MLFSFGAEVGAGCSVLFSSCEAVGAGFCQPDFEEPPLPKPEVGLGRGADEGAGVGRMPPAVWMLSAGTQFGPLSFALPDPVGAGNPPKSAEVVMGPLGLAPAPEPESPLDVQPELLLPDGGARVGAGSGVWVEERVEERVEEVVKVDVEEVVQGAAGDVDEGAKVGTAVAVPSAPMMTT